MKLNRQKKAFLTVALLILAILYWGIPALRAHFPNYEHPMNELTRNMRTICVGRFLIDIPEQMTPEKYWQSVSGFGDIEVLGRERQSQVMLEQLTERREMELRNVSHETKGSVFKEAIALSNTARILVYEEDSSIVGYYLVDAFVLSDSRMFKLSYKTTEAKLEETKRKMAQAIAQIQRRENDVVPLDKGVCIDGGLISDPSEYRRESNSVRLIFKEYPGFELKVHIDSTDNPQTESLLDKAALLPKLAAFYGNLSIDVLRKTKRKLEEMFGEELATYGEERNKDGDHGSLSFTWQYNGEAGSLRHPAVTFDVNYDFGRNAQRLAHEDAYRDGKASPPPPKRLTKDEAVAIWDAVLKSFRPRPGAF